MVHSIPIAIFAIFAFYVVRVVRQHHALRHFGGHWSAGWSRLWLLRTQSSGEMHKHFTAINKQHGSTARIGPQMLITSDPDLLRRMNAVRSTFTRGPWYAALKLHPERDNITSYTDERKHADLRHRMAPGYSGKENPLLEQDVDDKLLDMHDLIIDKYLNRPAEGIFRICDLGRVTQYFTLDVISKIAFGQTFGFLENDDDPFGYIANLSQLLPAIIVFGVYTELTNLMKIPLLKSALPKSTDKRGIGRVMGFAADRVRERFGTKPVVRKDMLGAFINKGLTQGELESETLTQITAGSDSTASSLRLTLHFISTSPPILERVLAEARAGIEAGKISRPVIKDSEARQLPYLQACIKEGLRMYPPVTGLLAKRVPNEGAYVEVDGVEKFVPGGTQIGWNSWAMMRHEHIFGADVEIYRPERWLPSDGSEQERARVTKMTDTVSLCFGYGRFGCLGRGVATMELNKAILETLLRFNLQPCSLAKPFDEMVVGFYVHDNMNFVVTERQGELSKDTPLYQAQFDAGAIAGAYEE
ncbi:related to pisatin demethylase (cytochrome P450) [Ramularia collo-cygni]|uniref:Related to pisatin demethylase (Cytochrome P450) n=1 Tax=Ramularia collo-cygni TaxID=112498 RepID=A0A2D3UVE5_9PEZI|nr:related to pisatin demethylase (cytochrome P450) [Ramularia collo-cygni]CZT20651.1 related to pisatin demethylase (cytochrome P450) [Ramularia collo-cygni]